MTKSKSKQIKQLKYLLLIPLLGGMVLYTACSEKEKEVYEPKLEKRKTYFDLEKEPNISDEESYMDVYIGKEGLSAKELTINDLTVKEKEEFLELKNKLECKNSPLNIKIHEGFKNRRIIAFDIVNIEVKEQVDYGENVPLAILDKVPTYPGCEEGDKDCLNKSMAKFIQENFNGSLANTLGLEKGKKRIYVQFKIDKQGNVIDINARAPHPALKQHAEEVVSKLPQMLPGEQRGKKVSVGYTLPITFNVE